MTAPLPHPYPVVLDLRGVDVLVVGGGRVAARKARALLDAGASVTAVAPRFDPGFPEEPTRIPRPYEVGDLQGKRLVTTATGDGDVDGRVAADADALGTWVNAADDPPRCSYLLPAVLRHGPVTIAVSTGGASPALASWIRDRIAEVVGPEVAVAAGSLASQRAALHEDGRSTEHVDWDPLVEDAVRAAAAGADTTTPPP